jgi:hypothetical protein
MLVKYLKLFLILLKDIINELIGLFFDECRIEDNDLKLIEM